MLTVQIYIVVQTTGNVCKVYANILRTNELKQDIYETYISHYSDTTNVCIRKSKRTYTIQN